MKNEYGIVLVGCGLMGAAHLEDIYYREGIRVLGVVDLDPAKARSFARKYGALSWGTDYRSYLDDMNANIFIIATYPDTHLGILRDCLGHNRHVLCEKPIATNIEDAREFVRLVKSSKSRVLVGHILRHNKTYNRVAQMIHNGDIGRPIVMRMVQNHHTMDWERYRKLIANSSPIIDCGVHYIDIMTWFTGSRIVDISGISARTENDVPCGKYNYGITCFKFEDGSAGYYEAGWGNTIASENIKEFIGPKGRIRLVYKKDRPSNREEGDLIEYYDFEKNVYKTINVDADRKPTWEQLKHLIGMIEEGIAAKPDIDEVFRAFQLALKADRTISNGK